VSPRGRKRRSPRGGAWGDEIASISVRSAFSPLYDTLLRAS
jgi:hypothetical protein